MKKSNLRPIFEHKKSEEETLSEITMLSNTFHGRQGQTKIYKTFLRT